jgi:hypothetical protein
MKYFLFKRIKETNIEVKILQIHEKLILFAVGGVAPSSFSFWKISFFFILFKFGLLMLSLYRFEFGVKKVWL